MKIGVIGCGRWGSLIAWYLDRIGHRVTLYGRAGSKRTEELFTTRTNGVLTLPAKIECSTEWQSLENCECLILSVPSQNLRSLCRRIKESEWPPKSVVLCMKGLEIGTGKRLSEIAEEELPDSFRTAVWLGPGHAEEFAKGVPNCMVIDSADPELRDSLVNAFGGPLIRFYYGTDLIGNEIGGATKNVIGIAAGMLDGLNLPSLKGALMSRGTREISRLIEAMGGNPVSAYGLCHLGDYEATVFSEYSHNRSFGEAFVKKIPYEKLAEGYYTADAVHFLSEQYGVDLPICNAVYAILFEGRKPKEEFDKLFLRSLKQEF